MEVNKAETKAKKAPTGKVWWWRLLAASTRARLEAGQLRFRKPYPRENDGTGKLVEGLRAILRSEKIDAIRHRHELGRRILEKKQTVPWSLGSDLRIPRGEILNCIKFAQKYPDIDAALAEFNEKLGNQRFH